MGLGPVADVSLAKARERAAACRAMLADGIDPLEARRDDRAKAQAARKRMTFGDAADALVESLSSGWSNDKHRYQWAQTLGDAYCSAIRSKTVDSIDIEDILAVLRPVWDAKPETAKRLRGRIEKVLDFAKVKGHRSGDNPAAWRGNLDHLLPKPKKLTRGHHAAMSYTDVPGFITKLRERDAVAALALEFAILTAARSGEVIGAQWSEIDTRAGVWIVPAHRMKMRAEHRVPLAPRVLQILADLRRSATGDYVFPGARHGAPMSNMALEMLMRRMGIDATVHGFRSAFRDWCGNETHFPREVAEAALAHQVGDDVERAYRRGDALEKRRALMDEWATFIESPASGEEGAQIEEKRV